VVDDSFGLRLARLTRSGELLVWDRSRIFSGVPVLLAPTTDYSSSSFDELLELLDVYDDEIWQAVGEELTARLIQGRLSTEQMERLGEEWEEIDDLDLSALPLALMDVGGYCRLLTVRNEFASEWLNGSALFLKDAGKTNRELIHAFIRKLDDILRSGHIHDEPIGSCLWFLSIPPHIFMKACTEADGEAFKHVAASYWKNDILEKLYHDQGTNLIIPMLRSFESPEVRRFFGASDLAKALFDPSSELLLEEDYLPAIETMREDTALRAELIARIQNHHWKDNQRDLIRLTNYLRGLALKTEEITPSIKTIINQALARSPEIIPLDLASYFIEIDILEAKLKMGLLTAIIDDTSTGLDISTFAPSLVLENVLKNDRLLQDTWTCLGFDSNEGGRFSRKYDRASRFYRNLLQVAPNDLLARSNTLSPSTPYGLFLTLYGQQRLNPPNTSMNAVIAQSVNAIGDDEELSWLEETLITHGGGPGLTTDFLEAVVSHPRYQYDSRRLAMAFAWLKDRPGLSATTPAENDLRRQREEDRSGPLSLVRALLLSNRHRSNLLRDLPELLDSDVVTAQDLLEATWTYLPALLKDANDLDAILNLLSRVPNHPEMIECVLTYWEGFHPMNQSLAGWLLGQLEDWGMGRYYSERIRRALREIARIVPEDSFLGRRYERILKGYRA